MADRRAPLPWAVLAAGIAAASGCGPSSASEEPAFPRVAVTSAIDEIAAGWLAAYREDSGPPAFDLLPLPHTQAIDGAEEGDLELVISVADPPPDWFATPLSADALAVIVHATNTVPNLSLADLRGLFSGAVANWDELGGADLPVQPYLPYPGDDLRERFEAAVMGGLRAAGVAYLIPNSRAARQAVAEDRSAVGLIPSSMVNDSVRALRLDGVLPGPSTIADSRYPLRLPIVAFAPQEPAGEVREWLVWLQAEGGLPEP